MQRKKTTTHVRGATAILNAPYLLWSLLFILAPLALVALYAFTDAEGNFTLSIFGGLFQAQESRAMLLRVFGDSIRLALYATAICLLLAFPLAHFMAHTKASTQRTLMMLIMVPMWMNFLICTYSWRTILETNGIINTLLEAVRLPKLKMLNTPGAVVLGMVYNYLPFMILPIYTVMARLNTSLVEAAQDLGASKFNVLRKITVPLSLPGVVSGVTMVFVPSVSTFYISQKLGGKGSLIGDLIELQFLGAYNYNVGAALSLILMVIILICMMVMNRFSDKEEGAFVA